MSTAQLPALPDLRFFLYVLIIFTLFLSSLQLLTELLGQCADLPGLTFLGGGAIIKSASSPAQHNSIITFCADSCRKAVLFVTSGIAPGYRGGVLNAKPPRIDNEIVDKPVYKTWKIRSTDG